MGQATSGRAYSDDATFEQAHQKNGEIMTKFLRSGGGTFWEELRAIASRILLTIHGKAERSELEHYVGWSNLIKIGQIRDNPRSWINAYSDLWVRLLQEEIRTFRPHATIFLSGDYASSILCSAVGENWRDCAPTKDEVAVMEHRDYGLLVWGYHPRYLRKRAICRGFISGWVAGKLS